VHTIVKVSCRPFCCADLSAVALPFVQMATDTKAAGSPPVAAAAASSPAQWPFGDEKAWSKFKWQECTSPLPLAFTLVVFFVLTLTLMAVASAQSNSLSVDLHRREWRCLCVVLPLRS
jgi:hypothetical protein